ncbi:MAG TPA: hypothetical protein VGC96_13850 [Candidatus Elarobacter sp.]|jgi:hypothetical protein
MHARSIAALALAVAVAGCGGGGSAGPPGTPAIPGSVPTAAPQALGSIPMTIGFPLKPPASSDRTPQFVSPNAAAIAIYDGATLIYVANLSFDSQTQFTTVYAKSGATTVAFGSCTFTSSAAVCTLTITTTIGAHKFDVIMYPLAQGQQTTSGQRKVQDTGTPPNFIGVISSEGELSVTLNPGANPAATLTLLGVADQVVYAGLSEAAYNDTVTYGYRIQDSTHAQIIQPGTSYDNGPVTLTATPTGVVTLTPSTISTPPAAQGDQNFTVKCVNANGGTVSIDFNVQTHPNNAYASGLTYNGSNYPGAKIQSIAFTCDAASATIPITIDGKHRR